MRSILSLLAAAALALPPAVPSAAAAVEFSPGENFLVPVIKGWKVSASDNRDGLIMSEFTPAGDTGSGGRQSMVLQIFVGKTGVEPRSFAGDMTRAFRRRCEGFEGQSPASVEANGYPAAQAVLYCGRHKGAEYGSVTIVRAIAADENFYVVQRAWHGPPFKAGRTPIPVDMVKDWTAFMREVSVCDTRSADHACRPDIYTRFWPKDD